MSNVLKKLIELESEAENFGFAWEKVEQIFEQIESEMLEIKEHLVQGEIKAPLAFQKEIGDLFHAVISLSLFYQFNPEEILKLSVTKFEKRLNKLKILTKASGRDDLHGLPFNELMDYWNNAKK